MGDYREGCIERKAVQRGIVTPRSVTVRAKRQGRKTVLVEYRSPLGGWQWRGKYETEALALQAIESFKKNCHGEHEFRIRLPKEAS